MTIADLPVIQLDAPTTPQPVVVEGAGWIQTTPAGRGDRTYRDTALADGVWPATDEPFTSMTAMLSRGIPTDWTGPAKWNVARYADTHHDDLGLEVIYQHHTTRVAELCGQGMTVEEACRHIRVGLLVDSARASLNAAADRGSAIHRAIEALLDGSPVDRDDLRANGALPYLLAVERFLVDAAPHARLIEAVCFDRDLMVAGTVDFVGTTRHTDGLVVLDWKTRTKGHDRREKEAAQVAGYASMLTEHYYIDSTGQRRQLDVAGAAVVTFAPDGTWALHRVDLAAGVEHYRRAVTMARANLVSRLYDGPAVKADELDVNALALARLAEIPDSPERTTLGVLWRQAGLGAATAGELTVDDWPVVDELLATAEARFRPFPADRTTPTSYASAEQLAAVGAAYAALPPDLRARLDAANRPLVARFYSGIVAVADLADIEQLIATVAEQAERRTVEVEGLLTLAADLPADVHAALFDGYPAEPGQWTDLDVQRATTLWGAVDAGDLTVRDGQLAPTIHALEDLASAGKRDATSMARPYAELFGRPKPTKWADLAADPLLFAAVAAERRAG